jgi:pyruvate dehydrogenase E2 component (dihydrolipoamide acetyltransferase)
MRRTIATRLVQAKQTIPHFYLRRDIRLDALLAFRSDLNKALEPRGVKLSVNDFVIKAAAIALQQVPDANAVWAGDRILRFQPSDVAVAVAIEGGLFTPVLRDAEIKTLSTLSAEMKDLAARARNRKLAPHEDQGGSFAVSNLGMMGIDNFDAVINPPHGSILAVGAGVKKPVVEPNGEIGVATVMSVTLSVDHRVIDGALGAEFLEALRSNLEGPIGMLAEGARRRYASGSCAMCWSIDFDGSAHPAFPTTRAGTPATVVPGGTGSSTTEPAAIRLHRPTVMFPSTAAPAPIRTPSPILG